MFPTKTSWESINSVHSFKTVLVIYIVLFMLAMVTPIPAGIFCSQLYHQQNTVPTIVVSLNTEIL